MAIRYFSRPHHMTTIQAWPHIFTLIEWVPYSKPVSGMTYCLMAWVVLHGSSHKLPSRRSKYSFQRLHVARDIKSATLYRSIFHDKSLMRGRPISTVRYRRRNILHLSILAVFRLYHQILFSSYFSVMPNMRGWWLTSGDLILLEILLIILLFHKEPFILVANIYASIISHARSYLRVPRLAALVSRRRLMCQRPPPSLRNSFMPQSHLVSAE